MNTDHYDWGQIEKQVELIYKEKFFTRTRTRAVVPRRGEQKLKFNSVFSLSLLGHNKGNFLLVFDQNCRVYIEKKSSNWFIFKHPLDRNNQKPRMDR